MVSLRRPMIPWQLDRSKISRHLVNIWSRRGPESYVIQARRLLNLRATLFVRWGVCGCFVGDMLSLCRFSLLTS
ncbi:hypothetical protein K456DRAFT_636681 [Colletotrichum gloeosporioides 23]|nr:hypothetical protein K456DRAFT_636681 [Colletotrichum gloeosporioides 23]